MERSLTDSEDAEKRGFNLPEQHRLWRDALLPRLIIPLYWVAWLVLLPAVIMGIRQRRSNRGRQRLVAIEAGRIGWTQVFFGELLASAQEHLGPTRVCQQIIDRELPYLRQLRANLDRDRPTHAVLDVRSPGQSWGASLRQAIGAGWSLNRRGVVPIVVLTDAFYRRQRWHAATLTAHNGLVVTFASARIVSPIFPHRRLIGPMVMPISVSRLEALEQDASLQRREDALGQPDVCFVGSIYSPRKEFLEAVQQRLKARGVVLQIMGNKESRTNEEYWQTLIGSRVILTTTMQGPDHRFVDWSWVQQAVFRFIEATAAGAVLVASKVEGIDRFFQPGVDFLEYVSVEEAVDAIASVVRDPDLCGRIRRSGQRKASALIRSYAFWMIIDAALGKDAFSA